jgi:hypothetical protein
MPFSVWSLRTTITHDTGWTLDALLVDHLHSAMHQVPQDEQVVLAVHSAREPTSGR